MRALLALVGVLLGLAAAWWLAGAGSYFYLPYARSNDDLDRVAVLSLAVSALVLCPLLGWLGWRCGAKRRRQDSRSATMR